MNITVEIKAPELAEAIINLASALAIGKNSQNPALQVEVEPTPATTPSVTPAPVTAPVAAAVPTTPVQTPVQPAPMQQAIPVAEQVIQGPYAAPAPAAPVPTAEQTYTMEQLAVAATQLVDAGKRTDLVNLLNLFNVPALTALPKEQYGNFATKLREMGARI